jgi:hypothetical protein
LGLLDQLSILLSLSFLYFPVYVNSFLHSTVGQRGREEREKGEVRDVREVRKVRELRGEKGKRVVPSLTNTQNIMHSRN